MKRYFGIILALTILFVWGSMTMADVERKPLSFNARVWFNKKVEVKDELKFMEDAEITVESSQSLAGKNLYPVNHMKNSLLGIWSGGTCFSADTPDPGGTTNYGVPDGWYIPSLSTFTGVTRIDVDTIAPVSSVTPAFVHSVYLSSWDSTNAIAQSSNTKFFLYPDSGVSTTSWWIKQFAGRNVTFGAMVKMDTGQYVATGVTTGFIRPVINTHSVHLSGVTSGYWKKGDWVAENGWNLSTVTWDVPADASAFEVGFAMNPTVLAPGASTGDTVYMTAPFIIINPLHTAYVPIPGEEIFFHNQLDPFGSGGSNFLGTVLSTIDLSSDNGWNGIVPDDVSQIYATVAVTATYPYALQFYGDNAKGGVSFFATASGSSPQATTAWIPVSSTGTINVNNTSNGNFSGTCMFVHGAKMR